MQTATQFNMGDFLNFAAKHYPKQTQIAVLKNAPMRRRGMSGLGQSSSGLPDLSYLDTSAQNTTVTVPPQSVMFNSSATAQPSAIVSDNTGSTDTSATGIISSIFNSLTATVPNLLTAYTANKQLTACSQTNQARLSQGLPAIDCSSFAPTAQVGLTSSTSNLLLLLGGGALLLIFLAGKRNT